MKCHSYATLSLQYLIDIQEFRKVISVRVSATGLEFGTHLQVIAWCMVHLVPTFSCIHLFFYILLLLWILECRNSRNIPAKHFYFWQSTVGLCVALQICWIMSVTGECWSGGDAAYSVASLCRIMTSLLKVTSLTPETDSKTASSSPSRHLGLIWHFAHTELLTSDPCSTAFCQPYPVFCRPCPLSGALALGTATELTWAVSLCGATGVEVRVRASRPQICKCERLAGSDGGTVLAGIYIF